MFVFVDVKTNDVGTGDHGLSCVPPYQPKELYVLHAQDHGSSPTHRSWQLHLACNHGAAAAVKVLLGVKLLVNYVKQAADLLEPIYGMERE